MRFTFTKEQEQFRGEVNDFLQENLPGNWEGADNAIDDESYQFGREFLKKLAPKRWIAPAWPKEYGGLEMSLWDQVVFNEAMGYARAPIINTAAVGYLGPTIILYGTEEQKKKHLPGITSGEVVWCQGYSEPNSGSDLASLQTRAVADGDDFIINGQKVWNTFGNIADWCELLVRTDPDAPKHKGISCLLVDMRLPGIEARPLVTITGEREFSEIFFTDVRVPKSALLGPENEGWRVAMTTLTHERGGVASLHLGVRKKIAKLIELARTTERGDRPATEDPVLRPRLARLYIDGEHLKLLTGRTVS